MMNSSRRIERKVALWALATCMYHANSFTMPTGSSRLSPSAQKLATTPRTSSSSSLHAFATDVYLDSLYRAHEDAMAYGTHVYDTYYYSPMHAQEFYVENMAAFSQHEWHSGLGTIHTADVEGLRQSLLASDDLMTRIALAADYDNGFFASASTNLVADATMAATTTTAEGGWASGTFVSDSTTSVAGTEGIMSSTAAPHVDAVASPAMTTTTGAYSMAEQANPTAYYVGTEQASVAPSTQAFASANGASPAVAANMDASMMASTAGSAAPADAFSNVLAENTPSVAQSTAAVAGPDAETVNSLRNQLADMAYSFGQPAKATASASYRFPDMSQSFGEWTQSSQVAMQNSQKGISQALSSLSSFGHQSQEVLQNTASALTSTGNVAAKTGAFVWGGAMATGQAVSNSMNFIANAPSEIAASTQANYKLFTTDLSVSEVAERMAQGVVNVGKAIVTILNIIIEAISGETIADLVGKAQTAAADMTSSAVSSIMETTKHVGDMSVADALTSIAKLVVLVITVLYRIFNGILEVVSGKGAAEWGALAVKAVEQQADHVLTSASTAAADLSHKSLTELIAMIGHLEQQVTHSVISTSTNMLDSVDASTVVATLSSSIQ